MLVVKQEIQLRSPVLRRPPTGLKLIVVSLFKKASLCGERTDRRKDGGMDGGRERRTEGGTEGRTGTFHPSFSSLPIHTI